MLHLEISDTTAHIPDDVFLLPVIPESCGESVIGFIHDMKRSVVSSLKAPLIERDERVTAFEEIITILGFWWLVVDLPELTVSLFVSEFVDVSCEGKYGSSVFIEEFCRKVQMRRTRPIVHDVSEEEEGVIFFFYSRYFFPNFFYPFIENLLEIVWSYLRADDVTFFDGIFYGFDKFFLVVFDVK